MSFVSIWKNQDKICLIGGLYLGGTNIGIIGQDVNTVNLSKREMKQIMSTISRSSALLQVGKNVFGFSD
jgi:hypothetical protein